MPSTATVIPLRPADPTPPRPAPIIALCEPDIAQRLTAALFRPRALDRLETCPAAVKRVGQAYRPTVIVMVDDRELIFSADAARRIALTIDAAGKRGAALDLLQVADTAEALARKLEGGLH
ncbi:hypothetical protein [Brevundimonas sp.]|uniref:hypothetical protein n=1 Tax=Brevundimonas sp. TaxID=1871086 RepID=UPI0028997B99|nr:hypothetical protein [Brevundimonas sp.]